MFFARWDIFISSIFLYIKEKSKRIMRQRGGGRRKMKKGRREEGRKILRCVSAYIKFQRMLRDIEMHIF